MQQTLQTALQYHQSGRLSEAEALYRELLRKQPDNARVLHLLGLVAYQRGDFAAAVAEIGRAIALQPGDADFHNNLAVALRAQGQTLRAIESYRRALQLTPGDADVHKNLGNALYAAGKLEEAATSYREAVRIAPQQPDILAGLGGVLADLGQTGEAEQLYRRALAVEGADPDLHNGLANVLSQVGRLEEAMACYRQVLRLQPGYPAAARRLGWLLQEAGQVEAAVACHREAVHHDPGDGVAHYNLGNALHDLGRFDEAVASYREALRVNPGDADAHNNLGNVLRELGRIGEAIACYRTALALDPDMHHARVHLLHQCQHACEWHALDALAEEVHALVREVPEARMPPFALLATPGTTAAEQRLCAEHWVAGQYGSTRPAFTFGRTARPKIRLGYLSADFHEHATAYLIAEMLELHDAGRFEVSAYSYGPDDGSAMRQRLKQAFHVFEDIRQLTVEQSAAKIHADGIDILVDLKGYTAHTRSQILAFRPAPVQVNFLGYPGTMGAGFVDYLIGDAVVTPPAQAEHYTERLALMPHTYQPNDRKRPIAAMPTRAECGLPEGAFVFCGFNQTFKILPAVFDVWMRVLREVPDSVLWLLQGNPLAETNLLREAAARGVDAGRLVFAPRLPLAQHLARQGLADLLLDTLPYNAHTTASDALWAGVPVVTCMGETFAGRVAGSLLQAAGLPELVTHTLPDYADLARRLALQPGELAGIKARLRVNRDRTPLFDTERFTRNIETLYARMWSGWLENRTPELIRLDP